MYHREEVELAWRATGHEGSWQRQEKTTYQFKMIFYKFPSIKSAKKNHAVFNDFRYC